MKQGPVVLIEDDIDDQEFIIDALKSLGVQNEIKTFDDSQKALDFLKVVTQPPFIIISDVNIPVMNGLQLKQAIEGDEYLKSKSIPFVFLSTSAEPKAVKEAYKMSVQGFFVKENTYEGIRLQLKQIIDYWKNSRHPNFKEQ